jgi:DNA-binding MarR family transcriptional regulator
MPAGANLLFLREEELRSAQDLLFFAYRDFTRAADEVLEGLGMGRAHHRALHYIGRNPGLPVSDLLTILRITKQSLARVLNDLVRQGFITQTAGMSDRRRRHLELTPKGLDLERQITEKQRARIARAYRQAGAEAVEGFRKVLLGIVNEHDRRLLQPPSGPERGAGAGATLPTPKRP